MKYPAPRRFRILGILNSAGMDLEHDDKMRGIQKQNLANLVEFAPAPFRIYRK